MNRWLRIVIKANANTRLLADEVYYLGHLMGETGPTTATYSVSFADITPIRLSIGTDVDSSSEVDIDKSGVVSFADISAMRERGATLTNITVPTALESITHSCRSKLLEHAIHGISNVVMVGC